MIGIGKDENFIGSDIPAIIEHTKKAVYLEACQKLQTGLIGNLKEAREQFLSIVDWKDSKEKSAVCEKHIRELEEKEKRKQEERL